MAKVNRSQDGPKQQRSTFEALCKTIRELKNHNGNAHTNHESLISKMINILL